MTDVKQGDPFAIGWSQENRDSHISQQWGVQPPYILFSKHIPMKGMEKFNPQWKRINEMVIYSQVQDALLLAVPLSDDEVKRKIERGYSDYVHKISPRNIHTPQETYADFRKNNESTL